MGDTSHYKQITSLTVGVKVTQARKAVATNYIYKCTGEIQANKCVGDVIVPERTLNYANLAELRLRTILIQLQLAIQSRNC